MELPAEDELTNWLKNEISGKKGKRTINTI